MFRPMFRVVAVALVLFAFTASFAPVYAAPRDGDSGTIAESGWIQAAVAWLSDVIYGEVAGRKSPKTKTPKAKQMCGPHIDPWGTCG